MLGIALYNTIYKSENLINDIVTRAYQESNEHNVLGKNFEAFDNFSILIKFIEAKESV